jgi:hypothetical protein
VGMHSILSREQGHAVEFDDGRLVVRMIGGSPK